MPHGHAPAEQGQESRWNGVGRQRQGWLWGFAAAFHSEKWAELAGEPSRYRQGGRLVPKAPQYARGFLDSACEPTVHALRREACPAQGKSSSSSPFAASPAIPASGAFASALFVLPGFASALTGFPA